MSSKSGIKEQSQNRANKVVSWFSYVPRLEVTCQKAVFSTFAIFVLYMLLNISSETHDHFYLIYDTSLSRFVKAQY